MKMHDLGNRPEKPIAVEGSAPKEPKVWYQNLNITSKQVPELSDYELGDIVDFHIRTVIVGERKREGEPKSVDLEMRKAGIVNIKQIRKDADEMGISIKDLKDVNAGRKKG